MRLSDFKSINYGKNISKETDADKRTDIIHQIYLGDRQIWRKTYAVIPETLTFEYDPNGVGFIWDVNYNQDVIEAGERGKTLWLDKFTDATTISGIISWGDGTEEEWESGQQYKHIYPTTGLYFIRIRRKASLFNAKISHVEQIATDNVDLGKKLVGVVLGGLQFLNTRFDDADKGVFEDKQDLTTLIIPEGVTTIASKLFKNTGVNKAIFPLSVDNIGDNAFNDNFKGYCYKQNESDTADNEIYEYLRTHLNNFELISRNNE